MLGFVLPLFYLSPCCLPRLGSALLCFHVLPPSASISRRQPNLPLVSTASTSHFPTVLPSPLPSFTPIPSSPPCLVLKNLLPLKVLQAGQIRLASSLNSAFCQSIPLMKMSFWRLRLRGWEVCDLYVAPLASLSHLLNNQPRRACVPICSLLHPSYIINSSNWMPDWRKKTTSFSLWSSRQKKRRGGGPSGCRK